MADQGGRFHHRGDRHGGERCAGDGHHQGKGRPRLRRGCGDANPYPNPTLTLTLTLCLNTKARTPTPTRRNCEDARGDGTVPQPGLAPGGTWRCAHTLDGARADPGVAPAPGGRRRLHEARRARMTGVKRSQGGAGRQRRSVEWALLRAYIVPPCAAHGFEPLCFSFAYGELRQHPCILLTSVADNIPYTGCPA